MQEHYERPRMAVNGVVSAALHTLNSVFAVDHGPLALSRSAGVALVQATPPLRNGLMRFAMGDYEHTLLARMRM
jgi:2-polyprenyl-6-methoxyphenol hydroxylase-like FAD-dependent oxidoreductase